MTSAKARNVVVITDGLSWSLDPRQIARHGLRVTTVLIGENSLEGGVAELAGMTGGQVFVASGSDAAAAIVAAFDAARAPHRPQQAIEGTLSTVEAFRRGGLVAKWGSADGALRSRRQIGATAAMLAIPLMRQPRPISPRVKVPSAISPAWCWSTRQAPGTRAFRKRGVALSAPRTFHVGGAIARRAPTSPAGAALKARVSIGSRGRGQACQTRQPFADSHWPSRAARLALSVAARRRLTTAPVPYLLRPGGCSTSATCWRASIGMTMTIRCGDLHLLTPDIAALIWQAAGLPAIDALANAADLDPVVAVIAVLAKAAGKTSRSADRLARNLLRKANAGEVTRAMEELGLRSLSPTS
jgi:hypothetical protein